METLRHRGISGHIGSHVNQMGRRIPNLRCPEHFGRGQTPFFCCMTMVSLCLQTDFLSTARVVSLLSVWCENLKHTTTLRAVKVVARTGFQKYSEKFNAEKTSSLSPA